MTEARRWLPDLGIGAAVLVVGTWAIVASDRFYDVAYQSDRLLVTAGMALAAALFRRAPGAALALVWVTCIYQVLGGADVAAAELAVALVAFGAARYGSTATLWASGLSIPAGAAVGILYVLARPMAVVDVVGEDLVMRGDVLPARVVLFGLAALLPLVVPWLLGLLLRVRERSQAETEVAQAGREQAVQQQLAAEEVALLRAEQAALARDVHDVVGHSLAVILAQAESAQFLPDDDVARVKQTLVAIAGSARGSLQDVRQVLASTGDTGATSSVPDGGLDRLVEGVRAAGDDVRSSVAGTPQPLPPDLDVVAFRVLQEMLTNALKHGRRGQPIHVDRQWHGELRIEVENVVDRVAGSRTVGEGMGLPGMRRRLESVGGRLDTRERERDEVVTWTSTAWLPLHTDPGTVIGP
jgi:signal transduction histidine kinase